MVTPPTAIVLALMVPPVAFSVLTSDSRVVAAWFIVVTLAFTVFMVAVSALLLTTVSNAVRSVAFAFPATVVDSATTKALSTLVDNTLVMELA